MATTIQKEIEALRKMTVSQLRQKHAEVFGEETRSHHKQHLFPHRVADSRVGRERPVGARTSPRFGNRARVQRPHHRCQSAGGCRTQASIAACHAGVFTPWKKSPGIPYAAWIAGPMEFQYSEAGIG